MDSVTGDRMVGDGVRVGDGVKLDDGVRLMVG